ncbi:hypothetical protein KKG83_04015 [Candidatus Micrarchaeota archaeon]|nr:hypothetical protein [Candidatus Micrarchaeota archaeon]
MEENTVLRLEKVTAKADKILDSDLKNKSNLDLGKKIIEVCDLIEDLNSWGMLISLMEYGNNDFVSNGLEEYTGLQAKKLSLGRPVAKETGTLITPTKEFFLRKKNRKILELAEEISSDKILSEKIRKGTESVPLPESIQKKLSEITLEYCWVSYGYEGPALKEDYFLGEVKEILNSEKSVSEQKKEFESEFEEIKEQQKELEKIYHVNHEFKNRFKLARDCMFIKEYRKQVLFKVFYSLEKIQKELAKRLGVSLLQLRQFLPEELYEMLEKNSFDANEANSRSKLCVFVVDKGKTFVVSGKKAEKIFDKFMGKEEEFDKVNEFKGNTAFAGKVIGKAKIVLSTSHLYKLEKGDILVSYSTNPLMVPAMKSIGGIVTDSGGVTCHAAIVSREFRIPCIINTKIATKALNDGDEIEVDAEKGIVRVLKKVKK